MACDAQYRRQVALLLRVLPHVAKETSFALKGGAAINLFIRDMPRLSVDIDLTYLPVAPRAQSLAAIDAAMERMSVALLSALPGSTIARARVENTITRLTVRADGVQIKIEVTPVMRGTVYEPEVMTSPTRFRTNSVSRKSRSSLSPIFMPANWSRPSIASIPAICSTYGIFWPMKGSATTCDARSSST